MTNFYPAGTGQALGDSLVTAAPLQMTGSVWYVNSATGTNAGGTAGQNESQPLATLAQAITNASAGDMIVLMDGHTETLTGGVAVSKAGLVVLGAGSSGGLPTVKLTMTAGEVSPGLTLSGNATQLRNVWIKPSLSANATERVEVSGNDCRVIGCYFTADQYDDDAALLITGDSFELRDTEFVSIATSIANRPYSAIKLTGTQDLLRFFGMTIDGGAYGWSNLYAFDGNFTFNDIEIERASLLRGSDIRIGSGSTGYINVQTATGASKVVW